VNSTGFGRSVFDRKVNDTGFGHLVFGRVLTFRTFGRIAAVLLDIIRLIHLELRVFVFDLFSKDQYVSAIKLKKIIGI
jgi:hypothetical protein